jgi:hypothetical protein
MKVYGGVVVYNHIFLTSALVGGEWSASRPAALPPGGNRPRYPLDRELGGPQSRSGHGEVKIPDPTGLELRPSVVQQVGSRYTDYTIRSEQKNNY